MKTLLSLLSFLLICTCVQAQADISSMEVKFRPHIKSSNPADTMNPTTDVMFLLVLNDTSKINKVHIKAGKTSGAEDFFNYSFKVDDKTNLPPDVSCKRTGNTIEVIVLNRTMNANYYYEAVNEDKTGKLSLPKTHHYNK